MSRKQIDIVKSEDIQSRIFTLRRVQVILDRDLAVFYGVDPRRLRQQISRNKTRFPGDFMFQLSEDEVSLLVSQNVIPSKRELGGYRPYAFTEQGVAATSAILTSERAVDVSVRIVRSFVAMRQFIKDNIQVFQPHGQVLQRLHIIEERQTKTEERMDKFGKFMDARGPESTQLDRYIFFAGQIHDAHKFISDLVESAKKSLILLDNYIDHNVLTLFTKKKTAVELLIYTRKVNEKLELDITKFNEQYPPARVEQCRNFHDRFLIVDKTDIYLIGASIKDLGKKMFGFCKLEWDVADILDRLNP